MKIDGRYLKYLRNRNKLSLRAFADKIYASKSSVQRWEKSCTPDDEVLISRISAIYNMTAEEVEKQADEKFGATAKDKMSPEKLAELKYGVKWLIVPLTVLLFVTIAGIIATLLITTLI